MAITFHDSTYSYTEGVPTTSFDIYKFTINISANDILLLILSLDCTLAITPGDITWPSGFNYITHITPSGYDKRILIISWKLATNSEPSNYIVSWANDSLGSAYLSSFSGCNINPIDVYTGTTWTTSPGKTPSIIPSISNSMLIQIVSLITDETGNPHFQNWTDNSGLTWSVLPLIGWVLEPNISFAYSLLNSTNTISGQVSLTGTSDNGPVIHMILNLKPPDPTPLKIIAKNLKSSRVSG